MNSQNTFLDKVCSAIEENKQELFGLLSSLIQINSESFHTHGNEKECAEYIHNLCRKLGFESDLYSPLEIENFENHPDYMGNADLENRYNVTVKWQGESDENELMLMGHIDTVRIGDESSWTVPPLSGEIRDGKIFGRGACDDKVASAVSIFAMKILKEMGFVPKKNLLFTAYCDEEYGGSHGALAGVLRYKSNKIVNLDGENNDIWNCAAGGLECIYRFHSENVVNSADVVARAIPVVLKELEKFIEARRVELSCNKFYKNTYWPENSFRYLEIRVGDDGNDLGVGEVKFEVYTDKTKEEIDREFEERDKEIKSALKPLGICGDGFIPTTRFFHYIYTDPENEAIRDFQSAVREINGKETKVCASCQSDLSVILKYGSPLAFNYGIGGSFGDYGGAHQPDEHVKCDELTEYAKIIAAYIIKTLG